MPIKNPILLAFKQRNDDLRTYVTKKEQKIRANMNSHSQKFISLWFFILKAIAGSILGNATATWFKKTAAGVWFYNKMDRFYNWAADRYNVKILTAEEKAMAKFPMLKKRLEVETLVA